VRDVPDDAERLLALPAEMRNISQWKKARLLQKKKEKKKKAADEAVSQSGNVPTPLASDSEQEHDEDVPDLDRSDDADDQPFQPSPARKRKMKRLAQKRRKQSPRSNVGSGRGASRR
jgi:hypothetical protein